MLQGSYNGITFLNVEIFINLFKIGYAKLHDKSHCQTFATPQKSSTVPDFDIKFQQSTVKENVCWVMAHEKKNLRPHYDLYSPYFSEKLKFMYHIFLWKLSQKIYSYLLKHQISLGSCTLVDYSFPRKFP